MCKLPFKSVSINNSQTLLDYLLNPFELYTLPLEDWITDAIDYLVDNYRPFFQAISTPIRSTLEGMQGLFLAIPPLILLIILGLIAWQLAGGRIAIYTVVGLSLIGFVGAWEAAMVSLSLVLTAVIFCMVVGISVGIACASNLKIEKLVQPFLDAMQTLPSFVYLVPVVMLFGIGEVPGVIATCIFAIPPLIRLTNLGIRQVSTEVVEAAIAFGSTPAQVMWEVQIPLAMPTILAGINQAILLALSMSVVTSMIGVAGLGQMVLQGLGRLNVGLATVGGLSIVLMAIILDRITQAVSKTDNQGSWQQRGPIGFILSVSKFLKTPLPSAVAIVLTSLLLGLLVWQQVLPEIQQLVNANQSIEAKENITEKIMPGEGVTVRPGSGMSQYPLFSARIIDTGLEKLGYSIKTRKQLNVPNIHIAVSNGDLDFNISHWEKLHEGFFIKNGGKDKFQRVGTLVSNTMQGYQIDQKTAKKYNITNIEQLKDPEIAKLFDSDGDGKANLIGCIPGWSCELAIEHHLDVYGLRNTVEHVQGDNSALMADTLARYRQGEPILFYNWIPNWVGSVLKPDQDVVWLKVPFTSLPEQMGEITEQDTSVDGKNLGFPIDDIRILVNKNFLQANPAAKRWFELVSVPMEDINKQQKLVHDGEDSLEEIYGHAQKWIEDNQQLFDRWVEEAREAGKVAGK
ncbi:MAG: glycine betaine/L-proline ABC transporter substrate-binding protein ProX [Symploca sp. SIO1C4]|uniref:Glycine betaine/L-proline ABC transporter substrate-binding protein ProX n=1 Tax=Symploca sp. SIO1C4 TaxID=2607765 RepID=A0A6B3NFY8_9CYAN|nr:glycine betaine/L-proline ABC transporter substrate-binding protein ProX [Symploca sp. SIO1C4]